MNRFQSFISLWQESPQEILALDFDPPSVFLGLYKKQGPRWMLVMVSKRPLPPDADSSTTADEIRNLIKPFISRGPLGLLASWRSDFIERPIQLPEMPNAEIRAAIRYAMEHHFSIRIDECLYDWLSAAEIGPLEQEAKRYQYFIYAVPRRACQMYLDTLHALSDSLLAIVPGTLTTAAILSRQYQAEGKDLGVLDVDPDSTSFSIYRKGVPLLSRSINLGTKALRDKSLTSFESDGGKTVPTGEEARLQVIRPQIEKLQGIMKSSIDFYHQQPYGGDLGWIYLLDRGSGFKELDKYLALGFDVPILRPTPVDLQGIEVSPDLYEQYKFEFTDFIPVLGSFLLWREGKPNLLPPEILFRNQTKAKTKFLRVGALGLAFLFLMVNLYVLSSLGFKLQALAALRGQARAVQDLEHLYARVQENRMFRDAMTQRDISLVGLLKFLSFETPPSCVVNQIEYLKAQNRFDLSGRVFSKIENPVATSAELVRLMNLSPFFVNAELVEGIREPATGDYRFKITALTHER